MKTNVAFRFFIVFLMLAQLGMAQSDDGRARYKRDAAVFDLKYGFLGGFGRTWQTGSDFVVRNDFEGYKRMETGRCFCLFSRHDFDRFLVQFQQSRIQIYLCLAGDSTKI